MQITEETLDMWFTYHAPTLEHIEKYKAIREAARQFAQVILEHTNPGPDQSASFRQLRECVATANSSIAFNGNS